jgi:hypothetical protein
MLSPKMPFAGFILDYGTRNLCRIFCSRIDVVFVGEVLDSFVDERINLVCKCQ